MKKSFLILIAFFALPAFGQTLYSALDKKNLAVGEPAVFKVRIENLQGKDVVSAPKNELLPFHFEERKDSINKRRDSYDRIIEFAVFQEGKFTIPALDFRVGGQLYHTIPYEVDVVNTAKPGDQISDIMANKEVRLTWADYWHLYKWYVLGVLIFLALVFIIYQIVRYGRRRRSSPVVLTNQTLKDLDALRKKGLMESGDYRAFYVELIDITRRFMTAQYKIPADVLLTDDLLDLMKKNHTISTDNEQVVEQVFHRGDMVKFAKIIPGRAEMEQDFERIRAFVRRSVKDLEFEKLREDV